jgi:hypothetical protein
MGYAHCRFKDESGCTKTGSQHWQIFFKDLRQHAVVPELWKHYMLKHGVQANPEERELVLKADPKKAMVKHIQTRGQNIGKHFILFVEKTGPKKYSHKTAQKADILFIKKLEAILAQAQ